MMIAFGLIAGLGLLILAGHALVKGAVALSMRLGIPALVVSLTVVAFGTSAPELVISLQAALSGSSDIAIGNVVGSNISNVLLVLGVPALIAPFGRADSATGQSFLIMIAASLLLVALASTGTIGHVGGLLLVAGMVLMLAHSVRHGRRAAAVIAADPGAVRDFPLSSLHTALFLVAGLVGLPLGAHLFVGSAVAIARALAMPEAVIGLTLVAVGTSLPELATSVVAALHGKPDVALGNVIGSNIFNILGILGITALVAPLPVPPEMLSRDLWVMLATSLLLAPFIFGGWRLTRRAGAVLTAGYAAYAAVLLT